MKVFHVLSITVVGLGVLVEVGGFLTPPLKNCHKLDNSDHEENPTFL